MKLLPTNPDQATRDQLVKNIIATYSQATVDQLQRGQQWYRNAHDLAEMISDGDPRRGAGVIAALSANKAWEQNAKLAARAFVEGKPSGHVGNALVKAARIMGGEDPESVLPMSLKTGHFYRAIADPDDPDAVVIDRHAYDVAVGQKNGQAGRGLSVPKRYAVLAHAYREAAAQLGVLPSQVQAVTWVVQVDGHRYERTPRK